MRIKVREPKAILFNDLKVGDLFYKYSDVFIKIDAVEDSKHNVYDAVSLSDGSLLFVDIGEEVNKLKQNDEIINVDFAVE